MRPRGTTLLETLVALLATSIVLAGLAGTVLGARTARARTEAAAERTGALRTTILRLAAEIAAARAIEIIPPAPGAPLGAPTLRLGDGLGNGLGGGAVWAIRADAAGDPALVRDAIDCTHTRPAGGLAMLSAVRAFRLRAFDGTTWSPDWSAARPPRAVELTVGVDDGAGGVADAGTVVRLPVGGPAS
jgi:type II secretory pathway pseudopilin PulG